MILPGMPHLGTYRVIAADPPWEHENYGQAKHGAAKSNYDELPLEVLCEIPVGAIAHPDGALLALWCTAAQEADGVHRTLASAWGFTLRTRLLTWAKVYEKCSSCEHHWDSHEAPLVAEDLPGGCSGCLDVPRDADGLPLEDPDQCQVFVPRFVRGPGNYSMQGCESLWVGTRGDFPWCDRRAVRNIPEALFEPRRKPHSRKPERAYARVEALWPTVEPRLELFARYRRPSWSSWGKQAPGCDFVFGDVIGSTWPVPVAAPVVHRDLKPENLLFSEASAPEESAP